MKVTNLSAQPSVINNYMAELRDVKIQTRKDVFRQNIERIGAILGYEISKSLVFDKHILETPLGKHEASLLNTDNVVVITILRAGLPLHTGMLNAFPHAQSGFISAYRKHGADNDFEIEIGYVACPDLENKILILNDPMLATGSSFEVALAALEAYGTPSETHLAAVIASEEGVNNLQNNLDKESLWVAAIDPELNDMKYIVPGLGDAGDLSFGPKLQS